MRNGTQIHLKLQLHLLLIVKSPVPSFNPKSCAFTGGVIIVIANLCGKVSRGMAERKQRFFFHNLCKNSFKRFRYFKILSHAIELSTQPE